MIGRWALSAFVVVAGLGTAMVADAAAPDENESIEVPPVVVLSQYEVDADAVVDVTIAGFTARTVTVSVCGNRALRGSADCNMSSSESTRIDPNGVPSVVRLPIDPPPVPCPCLVRVSSSNNDEVATAEFTLRGHPFAEPIDADLALQPVVVSVRAERAGDGFGPWLTSSLGGATTYDVTYTIANTATVVVGQLTLAATVGRHPGDVTSTVDLAGPDLLQPGETWEHTTRVELPAPVWGRAYWELTVDSGAPTVAATDTTSHVPMLLVIGIGVLVVDLAALLIRMILRRTRSRRRRRQADSPDDVGSPVDPGPVIDVEERPELPVLVG